MHPGILCSGHIDDIISEVIKLRLLSTALTILLFGLMFQDKNSLVSGLKITELF